MMRVLALNKPEWYFILIGCVACVITGGVNPAFSIIFSKVITVFQICDRDEQAQKILMYCMIFLGLGVVSFASNFLQVKFCSISS
jgi:hypothetical protein